MGFIHETHGRIAIETRGQHSFIIHAGYGVGLKKVELASLRPGARFREIIAMGGTDAIAELADVRNKDQRRPVMIDNMRAWMG